MAAILKVEDVNPEDRQILEKLAKLQQMYDQIGGLRALLPEKLINPTRFALDNPGGYEPEKLAAYLHAAAQTGSRDVERFKKEWHSDDVRQLLDVVKATDLAQGTDAWVMDYGNFLHGSDPIEDQLVAINGVDSHSDSRTGDTPLESINNFKNKHPEVKVELLDEVKGLPVNITISQLKFQVDEDADGSGYRVIGRPKTESLALRENILENINENTVLATLLV
ncbi:hypothetical protein LTR84_002190 [Exophiala bonariae]|uniref:Uncharacterized protein n=1 Tax=Exophiala bonariae TaxID=1690606 RepID=A0AAV9NAQ0_9EURO|nr:hypothetical protein LTR84_002190 [Exophiala bonariae]